MFILFSVGKSLDKVAELREKGQLHKPLRKRKSKSKLAEGAGSSGGNSSVGSNQVYLQVFSHIYIPSCGSK